jgi:hypothetical protein
MPTLFVAAQPAQQAARCLDQMAYRMISHAEAVAASVMVSQSQSLSADLYAWIARTRLTNRSFSTSWETYE